MDLKTVFPKASKSFLECNSGKVTPEKPVQVNVVRSKAKRGAMNKTEREFSFLLESQKRAGEIVSWQFEGITLRLADGCKYTPDFLVVVGLSPLVVRLIEVKGRHIWDDAKVKWRVAKDRYPWADWQLWQRADGRWSRLL